MNSTSLTPICGMRYKPPEANPAPNLRVVLDTSVVLMPIIRPNSGDAWMREAWQNRTLLPLTSNDTEAELIKTLHNARFNLNERQVAAIAGLYLSHCQKIVIPNPPPPTPQCRDASDQPFLTLAYQAQSDYLVTRDDDLLSLREESDIPIIKPADLRAIIDTGPAELTGTAWASG